MTPLTPRELKVIVANFVKVKFTSLQPGDLTLPHGWTVEFEEIPLGFYVILKNRSRTQRFKVTVAAIR